MAAPPIVAAARPGSRARRRSARSSRRRWRRSGAAIRTSYSVSLLDGVTGSGKTEVFFEAVADTLRAGRQALILLPEIALTHTFLDRFTRRFGTRPAEWHSDMTPAQRTRTWRGVLDGTVRAVVGARSALFLPFRELGLIVLDEEHDGAFKQSDGINYHARDMAVVRAHLANARAILSSATPRSNRATTPILAATAHVRLTSRFADAAMPDITALDMREEPPEKGQLDRAAPRARNLCHARPRRAGAAVPQPPRLCAADALPRLRPSVPVPGLLGVAGRAPLPRRADVPPLRARAAHAEDLRRMRRGRFADRHRSRHRAGRRGGGGAVSRRADGDPLVRHGQPCPAQDRFSEIEKGEYDLIIGTQLVAKGHHFEKLTLVGVLDADLGLAHGDPRAAEKTFQILTQVTGRAGRAAKAGRAFLQTYHPTHPVIEAMVKGDSEAFYAHELKVREEGGLPPFGRLAALIVSANEHDDAMGFAKKLLVGGADGRGAAALRPGRRSGRHGARPPPRPAAGTEPQAISTSRAMSDSGSAAAARDRQSARAGRHRSDELFLSSATEHHSCDAVRRKSPSASLARRYVAMLEGARITGGHGRPFSRINIGDAGAFPRGLWTLRRNRMDATLAAQNSVVAHIAQPYATALFDLAQEQGSVDAVEADLVADLRASSPKARISRGSSVRR